MPVSFFRSRFGAAGKADADRVAAVAGDSPAPQTTQDTQEMRQPVRGGGGGGGGGGATTTAAPSAPYAAAASPPRSSGGANRARSPFQIRTNIQIHEGETPAVFGHLYASVEQQVAAVGNRLWRDTGSGTRSNSGGGGVLMRAPAGPSCVLGVTSAIGGEGKTTVALHLALNAARNTFKSVCLIDLSLGENDLCRRLGVDSAGGGVMDALENPDDAAPTLPLVQLVGSDGLVILPAGKAPINAAKVARSPRVAELIQAVRQMFDVVIVDLPAIQTDNTLPISAHLDGVLMVVCAGATPKHIVSGALDSVGRERVLGVVLNRTTSSVPSWLRKRLGRAA